MKPETIAAFGTFSYSAVLPAEFPQMGASRADLCMGSWPGQAHEVVPTVQASRPRPWIRYWARSADLVLAGAALAIALSGAGLEVKQWNNFAFGWLVVMLWIPIEAALLCSCGTTPGKWLFNIRLTKPDRSYLTFQQALGRAIGVVVKGQGFGMPIVSFFTQIAAWGRLNRRGVTSWDEQHDVVVTHNPIGAGRILGIIFSIFALLVLIALGNAMGDPTGSAPGLNVMSY